LRVFPKQTECAYLIEWLIRCCQRNVACQEARPLAVLSEELRLLRGRAVRQLAQMTKHSPVRHFKTSPEIIHRAVILDICFPLSLRDLKDLLHERGIKIRDGAVRYRLRGIPF
jgi:hypothetical protein